MATCTVCIYIYVDIQSEHVAPSTFLEPLLPLTVFVFFATIVLVPDKAAVTNFLCAMTSFLHRLSIEFVWIRCEVIRKLQQQSAAVQREAVVSAGAQGHPLTWKLLWACAWLLKDVQMVSACAMCWYVLWDWSGWNDFAWCFRTWMVGEGGDPWRISLESQLAAVVSDQILVLEPMRAWRTNGTRFEDITQTDKDFSEYRFINAKACKGHSPTEEVYVLGEAWEIALGVWCSSWSLDCWPRYFVESSPVGFRGQYSQALIFLNSSKRLSRCFKIFQTYSRL